LPGIDLVFSDSAPHYDLSRDVVTFSGHGLNHPVQCAISREALDDHFGADGLGQEGRIERFLKNRSAIEGMARIKYLSWPIEEPDRVLIRTNEVRKLTEESKETINRAR
jgi:hypothetical protein